MKPGLAFAASFLFAAAPAAAERMETFNNRLFVPVDINGRPATALLDSAAEMTIIDDDLAARLGLVPTGSAVAHGSGEGRMEARFAEHVTIEAAGVGLELQGRDPRPRRSLLASARSAGRHAARPRIVRQCPAAHRRRRRHHRDRRCRAGRRRPPAARPSIAASRPSRPRSRAMNRSTPCSISAMAARS